MGSGRMARVPRRVSSGKSRATLRSKNTVRLLEVLYPLPQDLTKEPPFTREIENKWIYIFHQPGMSGGAKLVEELFADPSLGSWLRMLEPGKGKDRQQDKTTAPYPYPKGLVGVPDEQGQYAYYLSPVQLGPNTVGELRKQIEAIPADGSRWNSSHLIPVTAGSDTGFIYYLSSGFSDPKQAATLHSYCKKKPDLVYMALISDPFAWTEDIHLLGYQGALVFIDKYRPVLRAKSMIARTFVSLIKVEDDTLDLANEFPDIPTFWNDRGNSKPQQFIVLREHPDDARRRLTYIQKVDAGKWQQLPGSAANVPELQVKMCDVEEEALNAMAYHFGEELGTWTDAPRHRIAELGCLEMEDEAIQLGTVHMAKVTWRAGEVAPLQKLLAKLYDEPKHLLHELLERKEASEGAAGVWEKYAPLREIPLSMCKLVENCLGAIAVVKGKDFEKTVKSLLGAKFLHFTWVTPDPKKLPKLLGKTLASSLKTPKLQVNEKSVLADSQEFFEKHHIGMWFKGAELSAKGISLCFTLYKVINEKTTTADKAKAALDTISFTADVNEFRLKFEFGEKVELEGSSKVLAKAGAVAGIVTGFVDFYVTSDAFGKAWCMDQNYAVAAVEVVAGLGIAVGITASAFGLIFGEAVSGPVGWIALGVTLLGLLTAWLIKKFTRSKFEEVACYSFLGRQHVRGRSELESAYYADYFGGGRRHFMTDLRSQWRAITGLLSAFKLDAGHPEAILGKITLTPGWVQPQTIFNFKWQFESQWQSGYRAVLVEASLRMSDLSLGDPEGKGSPKVTLVGFAPNADVKLEWAWELDADLGEDDDDEIPTIRSFTIGPQVVENGYTKPVFDVTTVLAQVDVLGDGKLMLPFNDDDGEVEVSGGPLAGKHPGWVMCRTVSVHREAHTEVPVGL